MPTYAKVSYFPKNGRWYAFQGKQSWICLVGTVELEEGVYEIQTSEGNPYCEPLRYMGKGFKRPSTKNAFKVKGEICSTNDANGATAQEPSTTTNQKDSNTVDNATDQDQSQWNTLPTETLLQRFRRLKKQEKTTPRE